MNKGCKPDDFGRVFNEARKAQGFVSQEHLDAFYKAHDHTSTCPTCTKVGGYAPLDDGMQPYMARCEVGRDLEVKSFAY